MNFLSRKRSYLILLSVLFVCTLLSLCVGRYSVTLFEVFLSANPSMAYNVILKLRLPRIVFAIFAGGALSLSGSVLQGVFRNPLVSPDVIGVSSGASLGAAIAILFLKAQPEIIKLSAFIGGLLAVLLVYRIAKASKMKGLISLILSGIVVSALSQAGIQLLKYTADPLNQLPTLEYWLMGSLNTVTWEKVMAALPILIIGSGVILLLGWQLDILSMGDEEATALGANVWLIRLVLITIVALMVGMIISTTGLISWIGLIGPHIARLLFGHSSRKYIVNSFLCGGILLLLADTLARSIAPMEIPISVITALISAPMIIYLVINGTNKGASNEDRA